MRNVSALALGLLIMGLGLYGAAAVTPLAYPAAFDAQGATSNAVAAFVMLSISVVFTMFAGWVTARLAPDHRLGHALLMAASGLAIAIFVGAVRWGAAPSWYYVATWALIPVAAALGAACLPFMRIERSHAAARRIAAT
jgi:hypothetical protein